MELSCIYYSLSKEKDHKLKMDSLKKIISKHLPFITNFLIWLRKNFREKIPSLSDPLSYQYRYQFYKKNKLIFIHVPKAAGSSISKSLYGNNKGHMSYDYLYKLFGDNFRYFTVLRNPKSRLESSIKYALSGGTNEGLYHGPKFDSETVLIDLKNYLRITENKDRDPIFRTQKFFVGDGLGIEFIGVLDDMTKVKEFLEKYDIEFNEYRKKNKNNFEFCFDEIELNSIIDEFYYEDVKLYERFR